MNRIFIVVILLTVFNGCSKKTSPHGLTFIKPIYQDGSYFEGEGNKTRTRFDTLFNDESIPREFEVYRMTTSNAYTEDVFLVYSDKVVSYNQDSDGKDYYVMRKIYDASFQKKIIMLMDSVFWSEPNKDNTSTIHDGTIMQLEGQRGNHYQKILRKGWSNDKNILLLEDFFKWY
ncbi:MAG: hypothetical protein JNM57_16275 [Cyclobacteriaceae bacterium]|nr:hypothetical protein [Cyclobacteriaceae bacterium]